MIEAAAFVSDVIEFAVAVARPSEVAEVEAGKAVEDGESVAPSVPVAASVVFVGAEPSRIFRVDDVDRGLTQKCSLAHRKRVDLEGLMELPDRFFITSQRAQTE